MLPSDFGDDYRFRQDWNAVELARPVSYSLFTFGHSDLPYWLVCGPSDTEKLVSIRRGDVRIERPVILTPDNVQPEFENFFDAPDEADMIPWLLARTMAFSNLKLTNTYKEKELVSDSVEEVVSKLNRRLDDEEEDRVAILTAPPHLAGVAVLKYATERVITSAPDNVQELRERGLLP